MEPYTLSGTFLGMEGDHARLSIERLGALSWPQEYLPKNLKPGDTVSVQLQTKAMQQEDRTKALRKMLTELVN